MDPYLPHLVEIATGQHGALTVRQVDGAGLSADQRRGRVESGLLHRVGTHVLRSPFVEATPLADLAALILDCGRGAVVSGVTAAALHQFDGFELRSPFHVTLPRGRLVQRPPHHVHTTSALDPIDCMRVHGVPVLTPARALIDLARYVTAAKLTVALDSALRDRRTTEQQIHERIVDLRSSGRYGIPTLLDVIEGTEAMRGGHSWLERRFLELCASRHLPRPATQQVVTRSNGRLVRVDFRFPETPVIVEVLGYRWHRGSRAEFDRDAERLNALVLDGLVPMQFTYDHVTVEPESVLSQVETALAKFA